MAPPKMQTRSRCLRGGLAITVTISLLPIPKVCLELDRNVKAAAGRIVAHVLDKLEEARVAQEDVERVWRCRAGDQRVLLLRITPAPKTNSVLRLEQGVHHLQC